MTRDERETECYKWLFVVAAGVSWAGSVGVRSEFGGVSHKSAIKSPVTNEAVRQPGQAFNTSYNLRDLMVSYNSLRLEDKPTQAQIQSRLQLLISLGGLFTTDIAESHGSNPVLYSF